MSIARLLLFASPAVLLAGQPATRPDAAGAISLAAFGARPNEPGVNSRSTFQAALAALAQSGGATLRIPAGDYYLDFPDVATEIDPNIPDNRPLIRRKNLAKEKLIVVPAGVRLLGDTSPDGKPSTRIHWKTTGFPVFSFVNSDGAGMENIAFIFEGLQPRYFSWSQEDYLDAVGVHARWLGGPYEISTVIYAIGSGGLHFENLTFQSAAPGNEHTFAFGIVVKGKTPVPETSADAVSRLPMGAGMPGGGLAECVTGNSFRRLRFGNYIMGILAGGQCSPVFENISGNLRGSWFRSFDPTHETGGAIRNVGPPGHLIYLTFQQAIDLVRTAVHPEGEQTLNHTSRNRDIVIRDISEGPETLSNFNSLGTLALKNIDGGIIENVRSQHPAGLIQSMTDAHNLTLRDLTWDSGRDLCSESDSKSNCDTPAISLVPGGPDLSLQVMDRLTFRNVKLRSPRWAAIFQISSSTSGAPLSNHIDVDGLTIECTPLLHTGQGGPRGIVTLRTADTRFRNVTYVPVAPADGALPPSVNFAALIDRGSVRTAIDLTIDRMAAHAIDTAPAYRAFVADHGTGGEFSGGDGNSITRRFAK